VALRALGFPVKKADVLELLRHHTMVEEGQSDKLDYDTFRAAVAEKLSERTLQVRRRVYGEQAPREYGKGCVFLSTRQSSSHFVIILSSRYRMT